MLASLLTPYQSDGKYVKVDTYFFERVLSPIYDKVAVLIPRSITPNQITVFGGVLSLTSAYLLTTGHHTAAALVYLGYCTADNLDGKHARATKQCSDWGGILDHCVDGSCSVPATALTWSLFLGLPLVPLMRLIGFTFFVAHVVEAATGELHMGAGSRYVSIYSCFFLFSFPFFFRDWGFYIKHPLDFAVHPACTASMCVYSIVLQPTRTKARALQPTRTKIRRKNREQLSELCFFFCPFI